MKLRLKINGLLMFLATCLALIFPKFFSRPDSLSPLSSLLEVFGFAMVLFGLLLRVCARGYKSESSKEGYCLVSGGPYKLVRNPMYLGIAMIGLGVVLILFKLWVNVVFILIFFARYIKLIFKEEKRLIGIFGKDYQDYMKSTPRILPKISALLNEDIRDVLPLKLSWIKKEIGSVIGFILGILIIESWEDISKEGLSGYGREFMSFALLLSVFFILALYLNKNGRQKAKGANV